MDFDSYVAGIEPGGLNDVYEIKILICYLIHSIKKPLSEDQINTIFQQDGLVNYFGYRAAMSDLLKSNHISVKIIDGQEFYILNELGADTAETLKTGLPSSLRNKVVKSAMNLQAKVKKERDTQATVTEVSDGYVVDCVIHDIGTDLLRLKLFAPDSIQAQEIKKQFLENTTDVYKGIIGFLTNNKQAICELAEKCKE
ncbi:MAG: hypothetical protein K0R90_197 [Oscillospiraceae bacterium]|nr:hypothetical protein [Oscillospiraceae bacterium]